MTKQFTPPTLEEVRQVIREKGYDVDAEVFFYHYATNNWVRGKTKMVYWKMALAGWNARNKKTTGKTKLYPIKGKTCGKPGCRLPAVYHDTSGEYDSYACAGHMPENVKELYY